MTLSHSPLAQTDMESRSLSDCLTQLAQRWSDHTAVVCGPVRLSYHQLDIEVSRLAGGLQAMGIRPHDNVLLQLPNSTGFVVALFALFRIGAIPILTMPTQGEHDIDALCQLASPRAWLHPDRFLAQDYTALSKRIAQRHPSLQQLTVTMADDPWCTLESFPHQDAAPVDCDPSSVALLLLSGGTTGTPKLIPRTHADYLYNATRAAQICRLNSNSVYLATLPAAHNFTLACPGIVGTLCAGGKVVMAQTSACDDVFALIERERVTITSLVPPLLALWAECREWDDSDLSSLQVLQVGGSRLDDALAERVPALFGCQLQQVFGMAEGLICCTRLDDSLDIITHTQGRPISSDDEIRIVDENDHPVAQGAVGELLTRGPYTIHGYYQAPQQNQYSFTQDGYYRSGDLVRQTAQGNIIVEGRLKEQINRSGEKISSIELEQHLITHDDIVGCQVIGVSDNRLGERICACLQMQRPLGLTELREFLQGKGVSHYKLPDQLLPITQWPMTAAGKIDKRQLAAQAEKAALSQRLTHTCSLTGSALDITCILLQRDWSQAVAYEHHGTWRIGLGELAQIHLYRDKVRLIQDNTVRDFPHKDGYLANLQYVLKQLPYAEWQAFGVGQFELAYLFHGLSDHLSDQQPLLQLLIPRYDITLTDQNAQLTAYSAHDLDALEQMLTAAIQTSAPYQDAEQRRIDLRATLRTQHADEYREGVAKAVAEIQQGDYQKVILSRRIQVEPALDLLASYHLGRRHNTPARSFVVKLNHHHFFGFSPETVVEVSASGQVSTQPLAGTRALTQDEHRNAELREDLLSDTKEIAEHAVSVKLAFNEMLQVCTPDSVNVRAFMNVLQRGTVQHLASRLCGQLTDGATTWHALQALFPAVTASGIPKRQALDAIARHEPVARGAYSGSVMVVDSKGALDAALVLRSCYELPEGFALQAGAGIIDQSSPERELEETHEKLQSIGLYLVAAD